MIFLRWSILAFLVPHTNYTQIPELVSLLHPSRFYPRYPNGLHDPVNLRVYDIWNCVHLFIVRIYHMVSSLCRLMSCIWRLFESISHGILPPFPYELRTYISGLFDTTLHGIPSAFVVRQSAPGLDYIYSSPLILSILSYPSI